jgi:hypothetical protein
MDNPLGGITRGWPAIREVYTRIFGGPARVRVALHEATLQHHAEVFVAIGRERGELMRGGDRFDLSSIEARSAGPVSTLRRPRLRRLGGRRLTAATAAFVYGRRRFTPPTAS